jgi:DNA-binding transcriptional LysR family regulator
LAKDNAGKSWPMSDLDRLIRFAAVAEERSFSRAAKRLRVDQPWLSRQIQQLEAQLGFALLVRSTRKVSLTPEGERLLIHAAELSVVAEQAREAVRALGRSHSSVIAIGVNPFTFWIPARRMALERFGERYARASVELVSNYTPRLLSKLRKRVLDVVLIPRPFDYDDLEALVIQRASPGLLVPPENPLAAMKSVKLADLQGQRIATTSPKLNPSVHASTYGAFINAGAEPVVIAEGQPAINFYAKAERLVIISLGWPDSDPGAPGDFVHVPIAPPAPLIEYAFVRRREPPRALLNQFWSVAREVAAEQVREEGACG